MGRLLLAGLLILGCGGAEVERLEAAWITNNSSSPVVVVVDDMGGYLVAAGASGFVYSTAEVAPATGRRVRIASSPRCETLGMQFNSRRTLLIAVGVEGTVQFQQGADLSGRTAQGTIQGTSECQI